MEPFSPCFCLLVWVSPEQTFFSSLPQHTMIQRASWSTCPSASSRLGMGCLALIAFFPSWGRKTGWIQALAGPRVFPMCKESPWSSAGGAAQCCSLGPFPALSCLLAALQNVTLVQRRDLGSNLKSVSSNVGNLGLLEPGA